MIIATAFYETDWFKAVVYIVIAIVVARVVDFVLARRDRAMLKLLGKKPDRSDLTRYIMIRRLVFIGILFVGAGVALLQIPAVGTLARAMLASAAIIAGVIGIAARAPIANLVSGIMIAFSQPVRLNDYISVDGEFGTVEQISLIYTYIRSDDGRRVVIPNEAFAMKAVHNYSMGSPGNMVGIDISLPLDADVERIAQAMLEVGESLAPAPVGKQDSVEVADISGGGVTLRLHAWAADPLRGREVASDLRAALLRRLTGDGLLGGGEAGGGD
ncbi:MAG: mechanosensitive ion channel family protein [Deltaproteobacteria bacterium]